MGLAAAGVVAWRIATGRAGGGDLIAGLAIGLLFLVVTVAYLFYRSSPETLPEGAAWAGGGSLRVSAIRQAGLMRDIRVRSERRLRFWTRGVGAVSARLELRPEGLSWTLGRFARVLGVTGRVRVPWGDIDHVEVGSVPGTIRALGGGVAVFLRDGRCLDGQFLGSREELLHALDNSPLGPHK